MPSTRFPEENLRTAIADLQKKDSATRIRAIETIRSHVHGLARENKELDVEDSLGSAVRLAVRELKKVAADEQDTAARARAAQVSMEISSAYRSYLIRGE